MKKKRHSQLTSAADLLQSLFGEGKSPLGAEFSRWRLWRKWPDVVGPSIANQTDPVGLKDGILYVWVKNSVWMQQMIFFSKPMKDKINAFFGTNQVKMIRFTTDRKSVPKLEEAEAGLLGYLSKRPPNEDGEPQPGR